MSVRLTRQELYELVWKRPVTKVAADFGVSDVALHNICRKHNIPTPRAGYWVKVAAGKNVDGLPLPQCDEPQLQEIQIRQHSSRKYVKKLPPQSPNTVRTEPTLEAELSPFVEHLSKKLESAKPKRDGFIHVSRKRQFSVIVTPSCTDRAIEAITRVVDYAKANGHDLKPTDNGLAFEIGDDLRVDSALLPANLSVFTQYHRCPPLNYRG